MFKLYSVPESVEVGGVSFAVHSDYRDILEIIRVLDDPDEAEDVKLSVALGLFFRHSAPDDRGKVWDALSRFIACGEDEPGIARKQPKLIDWVQDADLICAEINKIVGHEIRELTRMHWFTFIGYYKAIGEGQLSTIVSIRNKRAKGKKLEKWEQEYYRDNKSRIDFKSRYSREEREEIERLKLILGE
jgi:hypothetical protein